ncbi:hypothetical protein [Rouxiella sp. Mn2063]|uniref:hypothetical protein n=1 Tax=Rouxiella sp. Mn2063 TaxID=3395262 RepID=UPI003BE13504
MQLRYLPLLASIVVLSGCATNAADCDPTTGDVSIITKFNCNYSGTYDKRVESKQQTLSNEQALNTEFKAVYAAIEQEKNQVHGDVASKQATYNALNKSMSNLLAQLKKKSAGQAKYQKQIAELETSLKQQNTPSKSVMEKQMELEDLRSQVASLQQALE